MNNSNIMTQYFIDFLAKHFKFDIVDVIELLTIFIFIWFVYNQYIKGTHSEKLVKGLMVLIVVWGISEILVLIGLNIIGFFLKTLVAIIVFSLVVVFQPELRKFLGYLGQTGFLKRDFFSIKKKDNNAKVLKEIFESTLLKEIDGPDKIQILSLLQQIVATSEKELDKYDCDNVYLITWLHKYEELTKDVANLEKAGESSGKRIACSYRVT